MSTPSESPTSASRSDKNAQAPFPVAAGILLGLGMGGFFDGIVLHQILQWHHMLSSAGFAPDTVRNLQINTLADGLFHASTYVFVFWGLVLLWRAARQPHVRWSFTSLFATMLMGFGLFNVVEGLVNHQLLGIHHVNETVPKDEWIFWDVAFLVWGALMLIGGWLLLRRSLGRVATRGATARPPIHAASPPAVVHSASAVHLDSESVAGEEDPGAALDMMQPPRPSGSADSAGATH